MVKIARLNNAFSEVFELEASPVEGQSLQQKITKEKKRVRKKFKKKDKQPKEEGHFLVQKLSRLKMLIPAHAQAKML